MAKIETTLPTVAFGNVKVTFTPEELGVDVSDAAAIGVATAIYLNLFTQGFKVGASMDVTASPTEGLKAPVAAPEETPGQAAIRLLDEGLGGVTEIDSVIEETIAKAAEIEAKAPWTEKVDAKPKPWETDVTASKAVVSEGW